MNAKEFIDKLILKEMKKLNEFPMKEESTTPSLKKLLGITEDQFVSMVKKSIQSKTDDAKKFSGSWRNMGSYKDGRFYGQFTVYFGFENSSTHDVTPGGEAHSRKGISCLIQISINGDRIALNASADVAGGMRAWDSTAINKTNVKSCVDLYANTLIRAFIKK